MNGLYEANKYRISLEAFEMALFNTGIDLGLRNHERVLAGETVAAERAARARQQAAAQEAIVVTNNSPFRDNMGGIGQADWERYMGSRGRNYTFRQYSSDDDAASDLMAIAAESSLTRKNLITLIEQRNTLVGPVLPVPRLADGTLARNPDNTLVESRRVAVEHSRKVTFKVTPDVSENKSVSYIGITDIRAAGSIHIFIGSPGRTFGINAKFVSRTEEEARENFKMLHLLKGWTVPEKGYTSRGADGSEIDSDTPKIVHLYGYGQQLKGIPTVLTSLNVNYPSDVDYISFSTNSRNEKDNSSIPIIINVDIQLQEVRSGDELTGNPEKSPTAFDIQKYKTGQLGGW